MVTKSGFYQETEEQNMFDIEIYNSDGDYMETICNVIKVTDFTHCFRVTTMFGKEKYDNNLYYYEIL